MSYSDAIRDQPDLTPEIPDSFAPLRGRALVELLIPERSGLVWLVNKDPQDQATHRGRVLALGPPARLTEHPSSPEMPWDCKVGDEVVFTFAVWLDKMRRFGRVAVVAQVEVLAVVEPTVHERETLPAPVGGDEEECDECTG